jgi:hypothetical protein
LCVDVRKGGARKGAALSPLLLPGHHETRYSTVPSYSPENTDGGIVSVKLPFAVKVPPLEPAAAVHSVSPGAADPKLPPVDAVGVGFRFPAAGAHTTDEIARSLAGMWAFALVVSAAGTVELQKFGADAQLPLVLLGVTTI